MTIKDAAKELKLDWHAVKDLDKEYMQKQLRRNPVAAPRAIGIDEISLRKVRQNFWPLRTFTDLGDVNRQAREWTENIANKRPHSETGEQPDVRFRPDALQPLPELDPDYRDTVLARVHKGHPPAL